MPERSDSYTLRKNPLNMRNIDGSDLILQRIDRLGEMANTKQQVETETSFFNNPATATSTTTDNNNNNNSPNFDNMNTPSSILFEKKKEHLSLDLTSDGEQSQASKSSPSSMNSTFSVSETLYTSHTNEHFSPSESVFPADKEPLSVLMSHNEKRNSHLHQSSTPSSPVKARFSGEEERQNKDASDGDILAGLPAVPSLEILNSSSATLNSSSPSSPNKSDSFLPLELSLASDDFSALVLKDFSRSHFSYNLPPSQPSYAPSSSNLRRKNTITASNGKVVTTPSQTSPYLFERMRSVRRMESSDVFFRPASKTDSVPVSVNSSKESVPASAAASVVTSTPQEAFNLGRDNSTSSNFTTWSSSTSSSKNAPISESGNSTNPNTPLRTLSSASSSSTASSASFDSHIAAQLCSIPSPVLNAITFTPPLGAVIVSSDENEDVDAISIFSHNSKTPGLGRSKSLAQSTLGQIKDDEHDPTNPSPENESEALDEEEKEKEPENPIDSEDRGRLFVRVEGLQCLQLPVVRFRNPKFNMTLDNGVQSVTIDSLPITATNPGVGQEFELVVGEDLQFILTFNAMMDPISSLIPEKTEEDRRAEEEERRRALREEEEERRRKAMEAASQSHSPQTTPQNSPKKQSRFRTMFSSPKKKHNAAINAASSQGLSENNTHYTSTTNAIQNTVDVRVKQHSKKPQKEYKPKDIWDGLIGPRGEFGRCYMVESQYEKEIYGRPRTFNVSLYNEWSYNEVPISSKLSETVGGEEILQPTLADLLQTTNRGIHSSNDKRSRNAGALVGNNDLEEAQRLAAARYRQQQKKQAEADVRYKKVPIEAYKIANLQVTMMYIPRATMEGHLPNSMKSAIRELNLAKSYKSISLDGFLSQEGGDCNYWRRRWFTLRGAELVGHTEDTKKVRNVLNLANVEAIVDVQHMTNQEKREMMASCMYHDRAFRMTFKDGEVISFYADSVDSKDAWMEALNIAIIHCTGRSLEWTDVVMGYHEYEKTKLAEMKQEKKEKKAAALKEKQQTRQ